MDELCTLFGFGAQVLRLRDQLTRSSDRAALLRDSQGALASESEEMLRRKLKELGSKLANASRVSLQV